jgi:hypothetical protein
MPAWGQTQSATVRGTVTDASGAVIASATLTLTNIDQQRPWNAKTNETGEYLFTQIPPGRYRLTVEASGFKKFQRETFTLEVAQIAEMRIQLELGSLTEVVEVTGETPMIETASSTLGEVVNSRTTESLPLNGRNVLQLVQLTPGINTTSSYRSASTADGSIASNGFSANGGRNVSNSIMLDGSPQEVMGYNQPAFIPSPDAVQEFKVQTNSLSAEYGRTGGAVVNVVHRSGTSHFHGVLYEFLRNDAFDANGFFDNRNGKQKGAFRYNQFGFTLGGPLTPSRQRTFFFLNYQGLRQVNPGGSTSSVPTPEMKRGDFSGVSDIIYDPSTIDSSGVRKPFAGNVIPASRINPVGAKFLSYYSDPTSGGVVNNFFTQAGSRPAANEFTARVDHRISDRQNIFGRASWNDQDTLLSNLFGNAASPDTGFSGARNRSVTLDDTYLLGNWVLHGNYGYAYHSNPRSAPDEPITSASLGLPATIDSVAQFKIFPRVEPSNYSALGGNPTWVIGNKFETHTATGDISKLIGKHSLKFGGTYRLNRVSNFRPNAPAGYYTFNDVWTRRAFNRAGGGNSIASMLLGLPSGGRIQFEPPIGLQVPYAAAYAQDDWRVSGRLTVNIGLRWDSDRAMTERYNRTSWFDYNAVLPIQPPGLGPIHGGLVFGGREGQPRGNKNADNNNFAPRVGFAYKLTDRWVLRSGFGIFYNPTTGIGPSTGNSGALSYNAVTNITNSIDGGRTPFATMSNPFPTGFNQPENGSLGLLTFLGQSINGIDRGDRTPYSAQWNLNLQYALKDDMLADIAYAGNSGVKLQAQSNWNQIDDSFLALGDQLTQAVANPFFGIIPATTSLGQRTTTRGQLLRPYPQLTGLTHVWGTQAHSSYHALQFKFRKRYRGGLQMLAAYTWSKMLDDVSSVAGFLGQQNPGYTDNNNRRLDKSLSALDVAHRLVLNYQYELPFGKGKYFLNQGGLLNQVVGGWSLNGITNLQSGLPISIASRQDTTNSYGGGQRPDSTGISSVTPGSDKDRIDGWFNPAAFVDVAPFTFGNVGRLLPDNRGPKLHNWDLSVLKQFPIRESKQIQFRVEFFNLFNHTNFMNPSGTTFGQPNFGRITAAEPARIVQLGIKFYY